MGLGFTKLMEMSDVMISKHRVVLGKLFDWISFLLLMAMPYLLIWIYTPSRVRQCSTRYAGLRVSNLMDRVGAMSSTSLG